MHASEVSALILARPEDDDPVVAGVTLAERARRAAMIAGVPAVKISILRGAAPAAPGPQVVVIDARAQVIMPAYVEELIAARGAHGAVDVGTRACHPAGTEAERRAAAAWCYSFRCKPELDNALVRNVYRPISGVLTRLFVRLPFSPNMITAVAIVCGQLGCLLAARPGYRDHVLGLFFVAFVSGILDCVDGEVARVRLQRSKVGAWLDAVGDDVLRVSLILAMGSHAAARYPDLPIGWITLASATLTVLAMVPMYWYCVTVLRSPNLQTYRTAMSGPGGGAATAWIGRLGVEVAGRDFVDLAMFVLAVVDLPVVGVFGLAVGGAVAFAVVIPTHLRAVR